MKSHIERLFAIAFGLWTFQPLVAQHYHLNVGAPEQTPGSPLYFQNGGTYGTNSLFVFPLHFASSGPYAGHHYTTSLSLTAIGTGFFTPPAPGTQVRLRFVAISGPEGGSFGVWDVPGFNEEEETSGTLSFSVPTGTRNGTQSILLSQNNGEADADPFGHIHGRVFSATKPGLYVVTLQGYDAAANGPGGGPVHSPSAPLPFYFQAGITIAGLTRNAVESTLTFATALGRTYFLQSTTNLTNPQSWQDISGPLAGGNRLETVVDADTDATAKFYRLRVTIP